MCGLLPAGVDPKEITLSVEKRGGEGASGRGGECDPEVFALNSLSLWSLSLSKGRSVHQLNERRPVPEPVVPELVEGSKGFHQLNNWSIPVPEPVEGSKVQRATKN